MNAMPILDSIMRAPHNRPSNKAQFPTSPSRFGYIPALLISAAFMLTRPSLLGEVYSIPGSLILIFAICIIITTQKLNINRVRPIDLLQVAIINLFWIYMLLITAMGLHGRWDFVLKAWIVQCLFSLISIVCICSPRFADQLLKSIFYLLFILTISSFITSIIMILYGPDSGLVSKIDYGYAVESELYLPFSTVYNWILASSNLLPRFSMWFREAGIAPIFLIWAAVHGYHLGRSRFCVCILLAGCLLTLSTVGIAFGVYAAILLTLIHFGRSTGVTLIFSLIALLIAIALIYTAPIVGLADKSTTALDSIADRSWAIQSGVEEVWIRIVGLGLYRFADANSDVNLLASINSIGLAGFTLFLVYMCLPILHSVKSLPIFLCFGLPAIFIALFSQPLIDAAAFTLIFSVPFWRLPRQGRVTEAKSRLLSFLPRASRTSAVLHNSPPESSTPPC